jgi:hypothetical protein
MEVIETALALDQRAAGEILALEIEQCRRRRR